MDFMKSEHFPKPWWDIGYTHLKEIAANILEIKPLEVDRIITGIP